MVMTFSQRGQRQVVDRDLWDFANCNALSAVFKLSDFLAAVLRFTLTHSPLVFLILTTLPGARSPDARFFGAATETSCVFANDFFH